MNRIVKLMCKYIFLACFVIFCLLTSGCTKEIQEIRLVVENDSVYELKVPKNSFITVSALSESHFGQICECIVSNKYETRLYYHKIKLNKNDEGQSPFLSMLDAEFFNDYLLEPNRLLVRFALPEECESVTVLFHVHMRRSDFDLCSVTKIR